MDWFKFLTFHANQTMSRIFKRLLPPLWIFYLLSSCHVSHMQSKCSVNQYISHMNWCFAYKSQEKDFNGFLVSSNRRARCLIFPIQLQAYVVVLNSGWEMNAFCCSTFVPWIKTIERCRPGCQSLLFFRDWFYRGLPQMSNADAEIVEQLHLRNLENVTSNSSNALFSYCNNFYSFVLLTMGS